MEMKLLFIWLKYLKMEVILGRKIFPYSVYNSEFAQSLCAVFWGSLNCKEWLPTAQMETLNQAAGKCGIASLKNIIFQLFWRLGTCHTSLLSYNPKHFLGAYSEDSEEYEMSKHILM